MGCRSRCTGLCSALLLTVLAPLQARGFAGEDVMNGPFHHEEISKRALARAGFATESAATVAWHADYIDSYLYSPLWWANPQQGGGVQRFRYSMAQVPELIKVHFDDLVSADDVRSTWNRYLTGTFVGLQWAAERDDIAAAQNILGISLHAIEDFYSHSSWVNDVDRREKTWFETAPADRTSRVLFTGAYEHPETGQPHHGKLDIMCTLLSQPELRPLAEAMCTAISPMSNSSICQQFKDCRDGTTVRLSAAGVTVPAGVAFLNPAGIALDNTYIAVVGARERGLVGPDGRLKGGKTQQPAGPELFEVALKLAEDSAVQWLDALGKAMTASGSGDFWMRVKASTDAHSPNRWAQFENFRNLPYQFLSAGPYPPDAAQRDDRDQTYLRIRLRTADEAYAGTDNDVVLKAAGREFVLDYAPDASLPMRINDFEQGDDFTYTVGPFDRMPSEVVIENRGVTKDDLETAFVRDLTNMVTSIGEGIRTMALAVVSGEADLVKSNSLTFALPAGASTVTLPLDGGSEGRYNLSVSITRTAGGPADAAHPRAWNRFQVRLESMHCVEESEWDRGSSSDEPFIVVSLVPMPFDGAWGARQAALLGPWSDIDDGESIGIGHAFGAVDLPEGVGQLALRASLFESDDESGSDRNELLASAAPWTRGAAPAEPTTIELMGRTFAADWKLADAEVYAFSRHPIVRGGTVANTRVDAWVASGGSITIALDPSAMRTWDAPIPSVVTAADPQAFESRHPVRIVSAVTQRMLLGDGPTITRTGAEGGWLSSPPVIESDANYYDLANWNLEAVDGYFTIRNIKTGRFLFSTGEPITTDGAEGGWLQSPKVLGSDANYYDRALWEITRTQDGFLIRNKADRRLLFSVGEVVRESGAEGGWSGSPAAVSADANYYNRAIWRIEGEGAASIP